MPLQLEQVFTLAASNMLYFGKEGLTTTKTGATGCTIGFLFLPVNIIVYISIEN